MLQGLLLTLILTGLGGLIVPTDPRTAVCRIGVHVRRAALAVVIVTLMFTVYVVIEQSKTLFGRPPS